VAFFWLSQVPRYSGAAAHRRGPLRPWGQDAIPCGPPESKERRGLPRSIHTDSAALAAVPLRERW